MGLSYSAGVFFGAAVKRDSAIGRRLDEYIDKYGGTPAPTDVRGIEIGTVGSDGERWITVEVKGTTRSFGRTEGECPAPSLLPIVVGWGDRIEEFLREHGAAPGEEPRIGWHFFGSVR